MKASMLLNIYKNWYIYIYIYMNAGNPLLEVSCGVYNHQMEKTFLSDDYAHYMGSIPGWVILKTQKMVLDSALLNIQHYKVHIEGKVEQSRERSNALPYTSV